MPLTAEIKINNTHIATIHIGRETGGMNPGDVNTYRAVIKRERYQDGYITPQEWNDGAGFEHRYGDRAEVCVAKAINALKEQGFLERL